MTSYVFNNKTAAANGLWKKPVRGKRGKPNAGFPPFPPPLEIPQKRGIPTFPTAPTAAGFFQTKSGNLIVVDRKECLTPDKTVTALLQNSAMTLILGVITLAAGLAMVLAHNIWSGGALVVVVTLVGWMALIKSLFFLFLSHEMEAGLFLGQLHYRELFYVYAAISLVLGVYLTYGGFKSRSH